MTWNNERRAECGGNAVQAGTPDFEYNDPQTNLVDALTNIMHHAAAECDFDQALRSARMHFEAEQEGDQ
jgi:hypothetical protein